MNPESQTRHIRRPSALVMIIGASTLLSGCSIWLRDGHFSLAAAMFLVAAAAAAPARQLCFDVRQRRLLARRIVILGSGAMSVKLLEEIQNLDYRYQAAVAGVIDNEPLQRSATTTWLGPTSEIAEIVQRVRPERIVVAVDDRRDGLPLQALLDLRVRGIIVEDAHEFYERLTGKIAIESLKPSALILSARAFRNHRTTETVARSISLVAVTIGLVLCAPLMALIALAIKLESRGPVLFVQDRVGKNGHRFGLLKFRTMRECDDRQSEWVQDNAHRITRLGKWLRRFRLDELPQLVNVLRGEMNLVGPRPHPTCNRKSFTDHIAYYQIRSSVRPGVTGWAQVRYGYANNLEEETEKMRYDLYYIKNRSLWLDARILLRTVLVVIRGDSASRGGQMPNRPPLSWKPSAQRVRAS